MNQPLKFIDLFAGIGGFHLVFDSLGVSCVFASDWDKYAQITYSTNFDTKIEGDIYTVDEKKIPSFDILCAGFPCQPFSIAGVSKKNSLGRKHGFEDKEQGNLFFEIIRIAKYHRPKAMFLENVKNLKSHDRGNTWKVITDHLNNLGYEVFYKIVDGKYYVPQHRERVFIICFNKDYYKGIDFSFPSYPEKRLYELSEIIKKKVDDKYTLTERLWEYLQRHKKNSEKKGNGFGYGLVDPSKDSYTRTISARYYKDGSEALIYQGSGGGPPRKLTPAECALLQGFPENFKIPVSDTQAYRQFGNSVIVPAIRATAKAMLQAMYDYDSGIKKPVMRFVYNQQSLLNI